jgi:hypothetical protein
MRDRAGRHIYFTKHNPRRTWPQRSYKKRHVSSRSCAPAAQNDRFYFGGHIGQPRWGFGWSTGSGS